MPAIAQQWGLVDWAGFVAALTAAATGLLLVWFEIDRRIFEVRRKNRERVRALDNLADLNFLIPPMQQRKIDYANQDNNEHLLHELMLPPDSEVIIELRIQPNTMFRTLSLMLGCHDPENITLKKPTPVELSDVYGQGIIPYRAKPLVTYGHVINSRNQYRWQHRIDWNSASTIVIGVKLQTASVGVYKWFVTFFGDDFERTKELSIKIEDGNCAVMRCVNGDHSRHQITSSWDEILKRRVIAERIKEG